MINVCVDYVNYDQYDKRYMSAPKNKRLWSGNIKKTFNAIVLQTTQTEEQKHPKAP